MEFKPANLRFRLNKGKSLDLIEKTPFLPSKFLSLTIRRRCIQFFLPHLIYRKLSFFLHFLMEFKPANLRFRLNKGKSLDLIEKTPFFAFKVSFSYNTASLHSIFFTSSNLPKTFLLFTFSDGI
jgi:hypothetical protein